MLDQWTTTCYSYNQVRATLRRVNAKKAPGPGCIPGTGVRGLHGPKTGHETEILGLVSSLRAWILDFLGKRPQNRSYSTFILNTGAPQGCVLSPLLFFLLTQDCFPFHSKYTIGKFADDTTVVGLIKNNDKSTYRKEVKHLTEWCFEINLDLNTTKEILVDFRKSKKTVLSTGPIKGEEIERMECFRFFGLNISASLTWATHTFHQVKKAPPVPLLPQKVKAGSPLPSPAS